MRLLPPRARLLSMCGRAAFKIVETATAAATFAFAACNGPEVAMTKHDQPEDRR